MAKKRTEAPLHTCRDCKNCHSYYSEGYDGRMILGRCSKSEHSKLLNRDTCKEFALGTAKAPCTGKEVAGIAFTNAPMQETKRETSPRQEQTLAVNSDTGQMALF